VAGEFLVEQRGGGGEDQDPGLPELLELARGDLGQGQRGGQVQLATSCTSVPVASPAWI